MKGTHLIAIRTDEDLPAIRAAGAAAPEPPLLHLRITGRHGVFLLQQGAAAQEAVVDTRAPDAMHCTCPDGAHGGECAHIGLLRACGFLPKAA